MIESKSYFIKEGYNHRLDNSFFDDTGYTDTWQREVYTFAKRIAIQYDLKKILDIGTGSGYKLLANFSEFETLGTDLTPTVNWLRKTYPDRQWSDSLKPIPGYDMIIASDVIEHIPDPDTLLDQIEASKPKFIVLSTPDRDLLNRTPDGPPKNPSHVREWTLLEFNAYISSRFEVLEHFISNRGQCTQTLLAKLKE